MGTGNRTGTVTDRPTPRCRAETTLPPPLLLLLGLGEPGREPGQEQDWEGDRAQTGPASRQGPAGALHLSRGALNPARIRVTSGTLVEGGSAWQKPGVQG